ncbi:MAG: hypothetical protein MSJ26_04585 [Oscillospiraceae bacterium]|nr:hypothetical protein [Oscillospiraceae bacterium]
MENFEKLRYSIYGLHLKYGKITPDIGHNAEVFYIVEHTDDRKLIEKEALQMLLQTGFDIFRFYGNKAALWRSVFDETGAKLSGGTKGAAVTYCYDDLNDFAACLEERKYIRPFVPCDHYLIYDDISIYESIKKIIFERKD